MRNFSYWYVYLPNFIRATKALFGADPREYTSAVAKVLRGGALDHWLAQQKDLYTRFGGFAVKTVALYPPALMRFFRPFHSLLNIRTQRRLKKILFGEIYTDKPEILEKYKNLKYLITGHFHDPMIKKFGNKEMYNISCPRLSTNGIQNDVLKTYRDYDFVLIDGTQVNFHHKRVLRDTPVIPENF